MAEQPPIRRLSPREAGRLAAFGLGLAWRADRRRVGQVIAAQTVQALLVGGVLVALQRVLGAFLTSGGGGVERVAGGLAALVGLGLVSTVLNLVANAQQAVLRLRVERDTVERVVTAAAAVDLAEFEDPAFHDRVERAVVAARLHTSTMVSGVVGMLRSALVFAAVGAVLAGMAWWLLPLLAAAMVPRLRVALARQRAQYGQWMELMENRRTQYYLLRLLTGREEAKEVRAFDLAPYLWQRLSDRYDEIVSKEAALQRRFAVKGIWAALAGEGVVVVAVVAAVLAAGAGAISRAAALTALGGLYLAARQAASMASVTSAVGDSLRYLDDLRAFLATAPTSLPQPLLRPPLSELRAAGISFTYPTRTRPAVADVSLTLRAGEVIALVGENGSGKTTLAKLLTGLYVPTTGSVLLNGAPADPALLRAASAVLFQDYLHYKLTAAENIGLGQPARMHDLDAIARAAAQAGADRVVADLPCGLHTQLGTEFKGGLELSLGQWQRIALARAFFRDAPLVVLDEPTSAMDPRAEADLFTHIRQLFTGRTVVLVSHRFSTVRSADHIYVLNQGRIVEDGTHQQLMDRGGLYAELFLTQAAAYLDTPEPGPAAPDGHLDPSGTVTRPWPPGRRIG